jgi:hypothetical protein
MTRGRSHLATAFTVADEDREKRIVEMDGTREGPFDRGTCNSLLEVSHHVQSAQASY